jgi:hypothetical protein
VDEGAVVALNPGTDTCQVFVEMADHVVIFEGSGDAWASWAPQGWVPDYDPEKFWVLVYNVPTSGEMTAILPQAAAAGVGMVYVTDDVLDNPWDTLPSYWADEVAAAGG